MGFARIMRSTLCSKDIRLRFITTFLLIFSFSTFATASEFNKPWRDQNRALVIDAYEYNPIDWNELVTNKRIVGFINKASDGVSPLYSANCQGDETERKLCSVKWKRFAVVKELYHTRRQLAKALGLKWGAYHLGRPGNPVAQADHFLDFARPEPDELVVIDIEGNDPEKWMSLKEAERFARRIHQRIGRYPMLYTNGSTADFIAANRKDYALLSRLPLWYARYKPNIGAHFPEGHWKTYDLWQFAANINCRKKSRCPYKTAGTPWDIDINVSPLTPEELAKAWPFGELITPLPDDDAEPLYAAVNPLFYATADDVPPTEFAKVIIPEIMISAIEAPLPLAQVPLPSQPPKRRHWATKLTFVSSVDLATEGGIIFEINRQVLNALSPQKELPLLSYAGLFSEAPKIDTQIYHVAIDPMKTASITAIDEAALPALALPVKAPFVPAPPTYAP